MLTNSKWGGWVKHSKSNPSPLPSFTRVLGNCWMALVSISVTSSKWHLCKGAMDLSQAICMPTGNDHTEVMKSVNGLRQNRSPPIVLAIFRDTKYRLTTTKSFQATFVTPEPSFKRKKTSSHTSWVSWSWVAQKLWEEDNSCGLRVTTCQQNFPVIQLTTPLLSYRPSLNHVTKSHGIGTHTKIGTQIKVHNWLLDPTLVQYIPIW